MPSAVLCARVQESGACVYIIYILTKLLCGRVPALVCSFEYDKLKQWLRENVLQCLMMQGKLHCNELYRILGKIFLSHSQSACFLDNKWARGHKPLKWLHNVCVKWMSVNWARHKSNSCAAVSMPLSEIRALSRVLAIKYCIINIFYCLICIFKCFKPREATMIDEWKLKT